MLSGFKIFGIGRCKMAPTSVGNHVLLGPPVYLKKNRTRNLRDGLVIKNTCFSCRGSRLSFQHPHSGSQQAQTRAGDPPPWSEKETKGQTYKTSTESTPRDSNAKHSQLPQLLSLPNPALASPVPARNFKHFLMLPRN